MKDITNSNFDVDAIGQNIGSKAQEAIDSGVPTQISYGFICGYSSGYALKKLEKLHLSSLDWDLLDFNHLRMQDDISNLIMVH